MSLINDGFNLAAPRLLDLRQGKIVNGNDSVPYASKTEALIAVPSTRRAEGLIVYIKNGSIIEQWQFVGGIGDNDLIKVESSIITSNSSTVSFAGNGLSSNQLSANVVVSSQANNGISALGDGIYSSLSTIKTLNTVVDISTFTGTSQDTLVVKDSVRGGVFHSYTGTQTADNGIIFQDANGNKWKRVIESDYINILWYGAKAETSGGTTDNQPFLLAAISAASNSENLQAIRIYVPACPATKYYYMANTVTIDATVEIFGDGAQSIFLFRTDIVGFHFNYITSRGSKISDFAIQSYGSLTPSASAHGMEFKDIIIARNISVKGFSGNGFDFECSIPTGNTNNSYISFCQANQNKLHGFYLKGSDANHISFISNSSVGNGGLGLCDQSFLGNSHEMWHIATNGGPDVQWQRGLVSDGTNAYQAIQDNFSGHDTTDTAYWNNIGPTWANMTTWPYVKPYDPATVYYRVGAFDANGDGRISGMNQISVFVNCYTEADQPPSFLGSRCLILSGINGAGFITGSGPSLTVDTSSLTTNNEYWSGTKGGYGTARGYVGNGKLGIAYTGSNDVELLYDDTVKAGRFNFGFLIPSQYTTAAMLNRTVAKQYAVGNAYGLMLGMSSGRSTFKHLDFGLTKPATSADLGDMQLAGNIAYTSDKPEIVIYKQIPIQQSPYQGWARVAGYVEYEFQTTTATPLLIFIDYYITKGIRYEIDILAANAAAGNGDLFSEKRLILISGVNNTTPTAIKSNDLIGTSIHDTSLSTAALNITVNGTGNVYNALFYAQGVAATTINWKVQIRRLVL